MSVNCSTSIGYIKITPLAGEIAGILAFPGFINEGVLSLLRNEGKHGETQMAFSYGLGCSRGGG